MEHVTWMITNLGFPYLGPIVFVKTIRILLSETKHSSLRKRLRLTYLLREGQYALTSLAVSTTAFYELTELNEWNTNTKVWLAMLGVLSFFAVIFVVVGLIAETEDPETAIPPGSGVLRWSTLKKWVSTYRVGAATLVLIVPVGFLAHQVHDATVSRSKSSQVMSLPIGNKPSPMSKE